MSANPSNNNNNNNSNNNNSTTNNSNTNHQNLTSSTGGTRKSLPNLTSTTNSQQKQQQQQQVSAHDMAVNSAQAQVKRLPPNNLSGNSAATSAPMTGSGKGVAKFRSNPRARDSQQQQQQQQNNNNNKQKPKATPFLSIKKLDQLSSNASKNDNKNSSSMMEFAQNQTDAAASNNQTNDDNNNNDNNIRANDDDDDSQQEQQQQPLVIDNDIDSQVTNNNFIRDDDPNFENNFLALSQNYGMHSNTSPRVRSLRNSNLPSQNDNNDNTNTSHNNNQQPRNTEGVYEGTLLTYNENKNSNNDDDDDDFVLDSDDDIDDDGTSGVSRGDNIRFTQTNETMFNADPNALRQEYESDQSYLENGPRSSGFGADINDGYSNSSDENTMNRNNTNNNDNNRNGMSMMLQNSYGSSEDPIPTTQELQVQFAPKRMTTTRTEQQPHSILDQITAQQNNTNNNSNTTTHNSDHHQQSLPIRHTRDGQAVPSNNNMNQQQKNNNSNVSSSGVGINNNNNNNNATTKPSTAGAGGIITREALMSSLLTASSQLGSFGNTQREVHPLKRIFYGLGKEYKRIYSESHKIQRLHVWQDEILLREDVCNWGNIVYSQPTSGGKTLVAEICMFRCLEHRKKHAIFVLPFVAVVLEKMASLKVFASKCNFGLEGHFGTNGRMPPPSDPSIFVCTIEKASILVNHFIENDRFEELGCIVVDEVHMLKEDRRGSTLEMLLTKIVVASELSYKRARKALEDHHKLHGRSIDINANNINNSMFSNNAAAADPSHLQLTLPSGQLLSSSPSTNIFTSQQQQAKQQASQQQTVAQNLERQLANSKCQIVAMSATIPNLHLLAEFLKASCYIGTYRPIPLEQYVVSGLDVFQVRNKVPRSELVKKNANTSSNSGDDDDDNHSSPTRGIALSLDGQQQQRLSKRNSTNNNNNNNDELVLPNQENFKVYDENEHKALLVNNEFPIGQGSHRHRLLQITLFSTDQNEEKAYYDQIWQKRREKQERELLQEKPQQSPQNNNNNNNNNASAPPNNSAASSEGLKLHNGIELMDVARNFHDKHAPLPPIVLPDDSNKSIYYRQRAKVVPPATDWPDEAYRAIYNIRTLSDAFRVADLINRQWKYLTFRMVDGKLNEKTGKMERIKQPFVQSLLYYERLCKTIPEPNHRPTISFCPSRDDTEYSAMELRNFFEQANWKGFPYRESATGKPGERDSGAYDRSLIKREQYIQRLKHQSKPPKKLISCLQFGVAFHHAGLNTEEREVVEFCMRERCIFYLFSTSTLAAGVNLPARRVVIRAPTNGPSPLTKAMYLQMCGRAGRKGYDTYGECFLFVNVNDLRWVKPKLIFGNLDPTISALVQHTASNSNNNNRNINSSKDSSATIDEFARALLGFVFPGALAKTKEELFTVAKRLFYYHTKFFFPEPEEEQPKPQQQQQQQIAGPQQQQNSSSAASQLQHNKVNNNNNNNQNEDSAQASSIESQNQQQQPQLQQQEKQKEIRYKEFPSAMFLEKFDESKVDVELFKEKFEVAYNRLIDLGLLTATDIEGVKEVPMTLDEIEEHYRIAAEQRQNNNNNNNNNNNADSAERQLNLNEGEGPALLTQDHVPSQDQPRSSGTKSDRSSGEKLLFSSSGQSNTSGSSNSNNNDNNNNTVGVNTKKVKYCVRTEIEATQFGKSSIKGFMTLSQTIQIKNDIDYADQNGVITRDDLHIIYLLTPINTVYDEKQINYTKYGRVFKEDVLKNPTRLRIAGRLGITEDGFSYINENGRPSPANKYLYNRFRLALILSDILNETPHGEICDRFGIWQKQIIDLQTEASAFAHNVCEFCTSLGWINMYALLNGFIKRFGHGVKPDLLPLMEIEGVTAPRARMLWNAGFRNAEAIAGVASADEVYEKCKALASDGNSTSAQKDMTIKFFKLSAAQSLVRKAQQFLKKCADDDKKEFEARDKILQKSSNSSTAATGGGGNTYNNLSQSSQQMTQLSQYTSLSQSQRFSGGTHQRFSGSQR